MSHIPIDPEQRVVLRMKGADLRKFQYILQYCQSKEQEVSLEDTYIDELEALLDTVLKEESYNIADGMLITRLFKLPTNFK